MDIASTATMGTPDAPTSNAGTAKETAITCDYDHEYQRK